MHDPIDMSTLTLNTIELIQVPLENPTEETIEELSKRMAQFYNQDNLSDREVMEVSSLLGLLNQKKLYEFIREINQHIPLLNKMIESYNQTTVITEKSVLLQTIKQMTAGIDNHYTESVVSRCEDYRHRFLDTFSQELQWQAMQVSLYMEPNNTLLPTHKFELSNFLRSMTAEKLNQLLLILHDKKTYNAELEYLYLNTDKEYPEFIHFLEHNAITVAGGHNSKIFKITPMQADSSPYILKIENQMNQPKEIVENLVQKGLNATIIPDISKRAYCNNSDQKIIVRNIVIQDYCASGNLFDYTKAIKDPVLKINTALTIYADMGNILLSISQHGGAFPDMKNSNWLLDKERLFIADDKSFRWQDEKGYLEIFSKKSKWHGDIIKSLMSMPPEAFDTNPIVADTFHSFSYGKNLYEYLTVTGEITKSNLKCAKLTEGSLFNFDLAVFKRAPAGPLLQQLIIDTVRPDPLNRLSLATAVERLHYVRLVNNMHDKIRSMLANSSYPYAMVDGYIQSILKLDKHTLLELDPKLDPIFLNTELLSYQDSFKERLATSLTEIEDILAHYPYPELQEALDSTKEEFQNLQPYNFDQFEADLSELLFTAQQHKDTIANTDENDDSDNERGPTF